MPIGYLTRAVQFAASHRYYRPEWSDEENRRRFGSGALPEGHGHNYRCEVTVAGPIDAQTGMVMDLPELDRLLDEEVVSRFHDRHINTAAPEFAPGAALPTTENLAVYVLTKLSPRLPAHVRLHRVRVQEDSDLWSEVYGTEADD